LEQLAAGEGEDAIRRRHAAFFLAMAEQYNWIGRERPNVSNVEHYHRIEREQHNLRAALAWSFEKGEVEIAMRLGAALARYWIVLGHWAEAKQRFDTLLVHPQSSAYPLLRAWLLLHAGFIALHQGDTETAHSQYSEALRIGREQGNEYMVHWGLIHLGGAARQRGDFEQALAYHAEALAAGRARNDPERMVDALEGVAQVALLRGDCALAQGYFEEQLSLCRAGGHPVRTTWALHHLGRIAFAQGDTDRARALLEESLDHCRRLANQDGVVQTQYRLGLVAW